MSEAHEGLNLNVVVSMASQARQRIYGFELNSRGIDNLIKSQGLISVVMSAYNAGDTLEAAIRSILSQSYTDVEMIVVDDGSTDSTSELLHRASRSDSRVIPLSHDNIGLTKSLNIAIQMASGVYVARQDADDVSAPDRLDAQLKFLVESKSDLVFGRSQKGSIGITPSRLMVAGGGNVTANRLAFGNYLTHGTAFGRAELFKENRYNEQWECAQDFELWLRLVKLGYVLSVQDKVVYFQSVHEGSISSRKRKLQSTLAINALVKHQGSATKHIGSAPGIRKRSLLRAEKLIKALTFH